MVGVILNLSVWFALHVMFGTVTRLQAGPLVLWAPDWGSLSGAVVVLSLLSAVLLLRLHLNLAWVLGAAAAGGVVAALTAG